MAGSADTDEIPYRTLLTDPSLVAVFFISGVAALGTNAVPVTLPGVGNAFALTETQIGLVMSVFSRAVLGALPVVSILADIYGRRPVVIPSLLLLGLSGLATLAVSSYLPLLALRAIQGITFAGTLPLTTTLTGDLYTGAAGSTAQGMRSGLNGLASAVAPVVAGVLTAVAWQYPFVLFALAVPVAGVVYRYYPETVEVQSNETTGRIRSEIGEYWRSVWNAADSKLGVLIAGGFTLFFLKGGFRTFLPVFVVSELGLTATAAGTILGVYGGTRVLVSPLSGTVMARLGRKRTMVVTTCIAAIGMAAIPFALSLWTVGVATVGYAVGEALLNPVVNDAVAAFAADDQRAGIMSGLQVLKNVGLTAAPVVMGTVIGLAGFKSAFLVAAAIGVGYALAIAAYFLLLARGPEATTDESR
jgi:MFS family permease